MKIKRLLGLFAAFVLLLTTVGCDVPQVIIDVPGTENGGNNENGDNGGTEAPGVNPENPEVNPENPEEGSETLQPAIYDEFDEGKLDSDTWLVALRNWGGYADAERTELYNNGVVPENVHVENGVLVLSAHGNEYEGDISGVNNKGIRTGDGKRCGACIVTKDYYASGEYEVKAKVMPNMGACSAIWTFEYEEYYPGQEGFQGEGEYYAVNHEIDIEMPGRLSEDGPISYNYALCNSWIGENENEYVSNGSELPGPQNDGEWHTYKFAWHTGDDSEQARVEYYVDGNLVCTNTQYIPTKAGRFWVGVWFPKNWAGSPDFAEGEMLVDYVKITPFNEAGDEPQNETYPDAGYAAIEDCRVYVDGNPRSESGNQNENPENPEEEILTPAIYDEFTEGKLDSEKWLVAMRNWGGYADAERTKLYNNGVVPENVHVEDGMLILTAHGNRYEGDISGVNNRGVRTGDGKRCGACIVTKDYFASGEYEIKAKIVPKLGACSAIWTFEYEEHYPGEEGYTGNGDYSVVNHEIDIEMPGKSPDTGEISYNYSLCNSWIGENDDEYVSQRTRMPGPQNDGEWHTYKFAWHTGDDDEQARVDYYVDDTLVCTNTEFIPTKAGRFWVGVWFPKNWAGDPDFDEEEMLVDYVKITPYHEAGDEPQNESYPDDGYAAIADCQVYVDGNPRVQTENEENPDDPGDENEVREPIIYDDFNEGKLNSDTWLVALRNWGGYVDAERTQLYNNGVVPENVHVENGVLVLSAHGDNYEGDISGVNNHGERTGDGRRCGACIVTKDYYASGEYEIKAKIQPNLGACSAIWTFEYEEHYPGEDEYTGNGDYSVINHEIDIEMPGKSPDTGEISYNYSLCNSWIGENDDEYISKRTPMPTAQNDGEWHTYKFVWHTGDDSEEARVDYFVDGVLICTNTEFIPTKAGRFWVGVWFPKYWAGDPNFAEGEMLVDYVKITPFNEAGDEPQNETYPDSGYAAIEDCRVYVDGNPRN
ncbi:Glycosyl hydrolases family 16 [Lachnospiraceae bacterium G11]|nr:Glycosyl hydrolases family 16 [Lachnospiraceae bacterium G11]